MFVVKVYYKNGKGPWELTVIEPVPEVFEFRASEFFFVANQRRGDSDIFIHQVVFLIVA